MSSKPSFQTYPGDWLKDPKVSACEPATRGIWWDMICAMHEDGRSGQLTGTIAQLAQVCRCTSDDMVAAIADLEDTRTADVRKSNGKIRICNRRMRRESHARNANAQRQKERRSRKSNASVTQKSRPSSSSSSSTSVKTPIVPVVSPKVKPGQIQEVFDSHLRIRGRYHKNKTGRLPSREPTLTKAIRLKIARAIREHSFDKAKAAGQGIFLSPFHTGKNDRNTEYLQPSVAWKMPNTAGNGPDNIEIFSELYFNEKARG